MDHQSTRLNRRSADVITHAIEGFKLNVDRGPNWLFIQLKPKRNFAQDIPHIADELWSIAARHFTYRMVLELDEVRQMPAELVDQLTILQERLAHCDGSLRISGLSPECAQPLRDSLNDARVFATRQEAVHGGDAAALHEKLQEMLSSSISDDQMQSSATLARYQPSLQ
jgi:hypothetical protein